MTVTLRSNIATVLRAAAPLVVVLLVAAVLLRFPPGEYTFYPQCPIYRYLHLLCPGCGTTRAVAALLCGHLGEALRFNALTTLLVPFAAVYAALCYWRFLRREPIQLPQMSRSAIYTGLAAAMLFSVVRNF
jgi:hypothetical protein